MIILLKAQLWIWTKYLLRRWKMCAVQEAKITALEKSRDDLRLRLKSCVQNLRVLRYNAFDNTGSDLSYSVALVDEENNGVVLSSIYGREENRCYAKPVIAGKSQYVLSKEEQEVLQQK